MTPSGPNIFNIPLGAAFLPALVEAILAGRLPRTDGAPPDPLSLCRYVLYLPNRRACRAVRLAFAEAAPQKATLLPRIQPLGEEEEDWIYFEGGDDGAFEDGAFQDEDFGLPAPPAIGALERQLILSRLVLAWMERLRDSGARDEPLFLNASPAAAAGLAAELARLIDEADEQDVDLRRLRHASPDRFSAFWELSADFLGIVAEAWPRILKERGLIDAAARRWTLMEAAARRIAANPPAHPVIIAGSTGSVPATAALMRAVLASPQGAVVLPGLDDGMDEESWQALARSHPEHPQSALRRLLDRLGLERGQAMRLPGAAQPACAAARLDLLRRSLCPVPGFPSPAAASADDMAQAALAGVSLVEAASPQEEAAVIAVILREAAALPGRSACLVTPDRRLARRVAAQLRLWEIEIDDAGGSPLRLSPAGALLEQALGPLTEGGPALSALLRHPLLRLGLEKAEARAAGEALDLILLREPGAELRIGELRRAMARAKGRSREIDRHPALKRLGPEGWRLAAEAAARLDQAYAGFSPMRRRKGHSPLAALVEAHVALVEALSAGPAPLVWSGEGGEAALSFMTELRDAAASGPAADAQTYPPLFRSMLRQRMLRGAAGDGRLAIWGPLEARLQRRDLVILGGFNEGTWPQPPEPGPWLSRAMRAELGFMPAERRIGQAAHDFAHAFCGGEAILTRADKEDGAPARPSRWLMRMQAALRGAGRPNGLQADVPWLAWARALDCPQGRERASKPRPRPPVGARPRSLSVTDVERLVRNPYDIFARRILGMEPLPPCGAAFDAREQGLILHAALSEFALRFPDAPPPDAARALMDIADAIIDGRNDNPALRALWRPRFERFATWFAATEPGRRRDAARILVEADGEWAFDAPSGPFTLRARADRIDLLTSGAAVIYDYKSGRAPTPQEAEKGLSPQLPLEGLIVMEGGFAALPPARPARLVYLEASGGDPGGRETVLTDAERLANEARQRLLDLVNAYDDPRRAYFVSLRAAAQSARRGGDYDHLARIAEWSAAYDEGDAE